MRDVQALIEKLRGIDRRGYKAYKSIGGAWAFAGFTLHIDHVQGDPFAAPSRMRVLLDPDEAGLSEQTFAGPERRIGTSAFLARAFAASARDTSRRIGSGRGGEIRVADPGQTVMAQTAVQVDEHGAIDARFSLGLPGHGRRVAGREAIELLTGTLPELVLGSLVGAAHDLADIERAAVTNEDAEALRTALDELGLIAFVADGARLARTSGVDDRPLEGADVVPFEAPESLRVEVQLPNAGPVTGTGIPEGVTLIVGGGFHGKSTLLRALQNGIFNHCPDDGRQAVVTRRDAVKVRAEDGRSVRGVDISPFIDGLPLGTDTNAFTSDNASGSTSQASAIVEALEAGSRLLLVDEDTSATNFMIRDRRMQRLVPAKGEPITPFVDHVTRLAAEGVSTVIVIGGSGDYLDVADRVIRMESYRPRNVTDEAREVVAAMPSARDLPEPRQPGPPTQRRPDPSTIDPRKGRRDVHLKVPDGRTLLFGRDEIDLAAIEQLISREQINATGRALLILREYLVEASDLGDALDGVDRLLSERGLDALDERLVGDLAFVRRFEIAAALNRLRSLRVD